MVSKFVKKPVENWDNLDWWRKVAFPYISRTIRRKLPHHGIDLGDEVWDNLVILDACRYDMFYEQSELPGELTKKTSAGSNTPEFLKSNFKGRDFRDTVYVTANPQVNVYLDDEFFKIINVWEKNWDEKRHTVFPEVMVEETIEAYNSYPNKRLISHFIQPHYPFIGEIGQEELNPHSGMELSKRLADGDEADRDQKSVWELLYERKASTETVWEAYRENLEITLPYVERLIDTFEEYTVVTSDHGNAVGERTWPIPSRIYGHPPGIRIPALTDVPWLITNSDTRKNTKSGEHSPSDDTNNDVISRRLKDLGYK